MLKSIYKKIPFKKELFTILKLVYTPPGKFYKHLHFKGIFSVKVNSSSSFKIRHYGNVIENELFWSGVSGGWEKVSLGLWTKLCEDANCIVDIGANTGVYALIAKAVNKTAKVYAYEPVDRVLDKLRFNNALNNYDIECSSFAISNKDGDAIIYDIPSLEHIYSVTVNKNMAITDSPIEEVKIRTVTLDTLINEGSIGTIDLMKIDVETHEPEVLEGYQEYIKIHQPTILIEVLNDEVGQQIQNLVTGIDYLYFNIDEDVGIKQVSKILKSDYYNYLLCSKEVALKLGLVRDN